MDLSILRPQQAPTGSTDAEPSAPSDVPAGESSAKVQQEEQEAPTTSPSSGSTEVLGTAADVGAPLPTDGPAAAADLPDDAIDSTEVPAGTDAAAQASGSDEKDDSAAAAAATPAELDTTSWDLLDETGKNQPPPDTAAEAADAPATKQISMGLWATIGVGGLLAAVAVYRGLAAALTRVRP